MKPVVNSYSSAEKEKKTQKSKISFLFWGFSDIFAKGKKKLVELKMRIIQTVQDDDNAMKTHILTKRAKKRTMWDRINMMSKSLITVKNLRIYVIMIAIYQVVSTNHK